MKLKVGQDYISKYSDLKVTVHRIHYESKDYYKARITISNARNDIFYDHGNAKLLKSQIAAKEWKLTPCN